MFTKSSRGGNVLVDKMGIHVLLKKKRISMSAQNIRRPSPTVRSQRNNLYVHVFDIYMTNKENVTTIAIFNL